MITWCKHCGEDIESHPSTARREDLDWHDLEPYNRITKGPEVCTSSPDALHHPAR